ncbi:MAG: ATP-binding protein [archaeon]
MTDFYNRYQELKILKQKYDNLVSGELILLWGRRRLGKTELIKKFLSKIKDNKLYFFVPITEEKGIISQFQEDIKKQKNVVLKITSWNDFFDFISEESEKHKLVVVFDEFQRFNDGSPSFISLLQNKWDDLLRKKKIMIILCGSSMGMMHNLVLSSVGPLYGRTTVKIKLEAFRYADFRLMFKNLNPIQKVQYFSVFGGTPYYLSLAKKGNQNLIEKIYELMIKVSGSLTDEPQNLLSWELKHPVRYNAILQAISKGKIELTEISNFVGKESMNVLPYIRNLNKLLNLISISEPFSGKKRLTRYKISDNFFRFWYNFIFSNKSLIEVGNTEAVKSKIKVRLDSFIGHIFEDIVKELFVLYNKNKIKNFNIDFEEIGSWWGSKGEDVDIIMKGRTETIVCEVKWQDKRIDNDTLTKLKENEEKMSNKGRVRYCLVSKSGFQEDLIKIMEKENILYLDLNEVDQLFKEYSEKECVIQRKIIENWG